MGMREDKREKSVTASKSMAIGLCTGVAIGIGMKNLAVGIAIGVAIGAGLGEYRNSK